MKKSLITLLTVAAITGNAQNWLTTLNSGATTLPKFGLSTNHSLSFFTNNVERMKLTNTGRLGIGQANPAYALDVTGEIRASTNIRTGQNLFFGSTGQFKMSYTAPSAGNPGIFSSSGAAVLNRPSDLLCGFNGMTIKAELFNTGGSDYQFKGALDLISSATGPRLQKQRVYSSCHSGCPCSSSVGNDIFCCRSRVRASCKWFRSSSDRSAYGRC
jgi:hypothetical protein